MDFEKVIYHIFLIFETFSNVRCKIQSQFENFSTTQKNHVI